MIQCDVCVIGGGPGGYAAALEAARLKARVVLVERHQLGGACLNLGCIPTKTMLAAGELFHRLSSGAEMGVEAKGVWRVDRLAGYRDRVVSQLRQAMGQALKQRNARVVTGSARFESPNLIAAGEETIEANEVILATGSRPKRLPQGVLPDGQGWTSDEATLLQAAPKHALIVGGGVVGCEFATIFRSMGSQVTLVEQMDRLLPTEDRELAQALEQAMTRQGTHVVLGASLKQARDGVAELSNGERIQTDRILEAVGRVPQFDGLGLNRIGLDGQAVAVDQRLRSSQPHIFAVGDCHGRYQLAHVAAYEGEYAARHALGQEARAPNYASVPFCIYTDPEVAHCGMTEEEAHAGHEVTVGRVRWQFAPRAMTLGVSLGLTKVIIDRATRKLLGLHILGPQASELIGQGVLAIRWGLTADQVAETIHAHPTLTETIREAILNAR